MAAKGVTLAATDFPLYTFRMVGDRHFLVAGGGGAAKTGVPNAMEMFELKRENRRLSARKVTHYGTDTRAVMNCDVAQLEKQFILAAGLEGYCRLYTLRYKVITPKVENEALEGLRKRKGNLTVSNDHKNASKMIGFEVEPGEEVETDRSQPSGFQKVARFTDDGSQLVTAGADGHFRVWKVPQLEHVYEVNAHSNEVDDLHISCDGKQIATVSRDGHAYIWKAADGSKLHELIWKTTTKHRFRNCRFGAVADKEGTYCLYTTHIPVVRNKRPDSCCIVRWNTIDNASVTKVLNTGSELLSALAISDDGIYLASGTISGSVSVYISFSLQQIYHVSEAHEIFVTGLEFAPDTTSRAIIGPNIDFTLFSISADSQIKAHQLESRRLYSPLWALVGFVIVIFLIYWLVSAFEL